jgi:hypothetical protein
LPDRAIWTRDARNSTVRAHRAQHANDGPAKGKIAGAMAAGEEHDHVLLVSGAVEGGAGEQVFHPRRLATVNRVIGLAEHVLQRWIQRR